MKREPLFSVTYFDTAINYFKERVEKLEGYINSQDSRIPNWSRIFRGLSISNLYLFFNKYSRGEQVNLLKTHAEAL